MSQGISFHICGHIPITNACDAVSMKEPRISTESAIRQVVESPCACHLSLRLLSLVSHEQGPQCQWQEHSSDWLDLSLSAHHTPRSLMLMRIRSAPG